MRSGYFEDGKQVGEWTTYDASGKIVKVTEDEIAGLTSLPDVRGLGAALRQNKGGSENLRARRDINDRRACFIAAG